MDDPGSISYLFAAALLLLANGLFVTAEFALVGTRRTRIEELINEGRRSAVRVKEILDQLDSYLSTCQVGITLASLGLGWIGEDTFARLFQQSFLWFGMPESGAWISSHALAIGVAFFLVTFLHVVIGELMPKTLALQAPEGTAMWVSWPMKFFHQFFWPLTWLLNGSSLALIRMLGLKPPPKHARVHSEEELGMIIEESEKAGMMTKEERMMLERVFAFHDTQVKEIMVPRPDIVALDVRAGHEAVMDTAFKSGYSRLPVYSGSMDNIVGIVYVKDLIYTLNHPKLIKLADLVRKPMEVPETSKVSSLLRAFQLHRIHMAIVIDEFGDTAGLVTLEDVIEEIVGEIQDETDREPEKIVKLQDGTFLIAAKTNVDEFNEVFPALELPEGDFDTVGGLVLHLAGHLPREGDSVRLGELALRVVKREGRRLRQIAVKRVPPGATQHFKPVTPEHFDHTLLPPLGTQPASPAPPTLPPPARGGQSTASEPARNAASGEAGSPAKEEHAERR